MALDKAEVQIVEVTKAQVIIKPWGHETIIADSPAYGCKLLLVKKGHRLSLQKHQQRDETWYVLKGKAHVVLGEIKLTLRPVLLQRGWRGKEVSDD